MKKLIKAILLMSMIILGSCGDDDENSLTAPTTEGKGSLSFLLNGEVWRPLAHSNFPYGYSSHGMEQFATEYDSSKNKANDLFKIRIWGRNEDNNQFFNFTIDSIMYDGKYEIKEAEFISEYNNRYNILKTDLNSNYVILSKIHRDYKPAYVDDRNVLTW
jgi:hypothetical protein